MSNTAPPGWYLDPQMAGTQRYWDGDAWTGHVSPLESPQARVDSTAHSDAVATAEGNPQSASGDGLTLPGQAQQPEPAERRDKRPPPPGTQWLTKWTGRKHKTKKTVLNAACQACASEYQLRGEALNRYAVQMSGWASVGNLVAGMDLWANNNPDGNAAKQLKYNRERADLQEKRDAAGRAELLADAPNADPIRCWSNRLGR